MSAASHAEVLAYCLARHPGDVPRARADAATLLRQYAGFEPALLSMLRDRYGPSPDPIALASPGPMAFASPGPMALASPGPMALASPGPMALALPDANGSPSADPIASRMRRQREVDDAMWHRVHEAAKGLLTDLTDAQRRIAQQEAEMARLTAEIAESKRATDEGEISRDKEAESIAVAVTRQQLQLLRLRGNESRSDDVLSELEHRRSRASAERRNEEELLRIYSRVLLQHVAAYPLSPLREELQRADAEQWLFAQK